MPHKKPQGKTTNKLIIMFKDYSNSKQGFVAESFRCNSIEGAKKIISKRDKRRIYFADFFDCKGVKERMQFNNRLSILSI